MIHEIEIEDTKFDYFEESLDIAHELKYTHGVSRKRLKFMPSEDEHLYED